MRIYVSIDAEGLPGIVSVSQVVESGKHFDELRKIMTRIARQCAETLKELGVEEVWIADSHGSMLNIDYLEMPRGTVLIRGFPRPVCMVVGIDRGFAGAVFIGYHSAAGVARSVMDHTMSGRAFHEIRVCGRRASEFYINALVAGQFNVPVILVAGDDKLRQDVEEVAPWITYVQMKESLTRFSAITRPLDEVLEELREGVQLAIEKLRRGECKPLKPPRQPLDLEIVFRRSEYADLAQSIPGVERVDAYTIRAKPSTPVELANIVEVASMIAIAAEALQRA